jgi:hypothetical protein
MTKTYTREYLESCEDATLAELYRERFDECYPFLIRAFPVSFLYGGTYEPDFRENAIQALLSGQPLPPVKQDISNDPNILY